MSPDPPAARKDEDHGASGAATVALLRQIQADQARIVELLCARFEPHQRKDVSVIARELWHGHVDPPLSAWEGSDQAYWAARAADPAEEKKHDLGLEFLRSFAPGGKIASTVGASDTDISAHIAGLASDPAEQELWRAKFPGGTRRQWGAVSNLEVALDKFKRWAGRRGRAQLVGVTFEELDDVWPDRWQSDPDADEAGNTATAVTVAAGTHDEPFTYYHAIAGVAQPGEALPGVSIAEESTLPICGVIYLCSIGRQTGIIDLDTAAAILTLTPSALFLDSHATAWRERDKGVCYEVAKFQSSSSAMSLTNNESPGRLSHGILMFHLRSFIVATDPAGTTESSSKPPLHAVPEEQHHSFPGVRCVRERTAFQGFYDGQTLQLVERRYSTALSMLPLDAPAGRFALVSVADTSSPQDRDEVWAEAPGYERVYEERNRPWTKFGLRSVGLYTGLAAMQLQICSFLEGWERDWNRTIDAIDSKISVQLDVLENSEQLSKLVLKTKSDASVLYFKVLQLLGVFADSVQEARAALEALPRATHNPEVFLGSGFYQTYQHTADTLTLLDHNWEIVQGMHKNAAEGILRRLDRSKNEILGLRDGLFNVQSVVEAQKSFELNKYLFIFTVVTIVYLPPTFVASFFGMEIFNAETVPETQDFFWTLIKWFCAVTYVLAIIALIGARLPLSPVADALRKTWGRKSASPLGNSSKSAGNRGAQGDRPEKGTERNVRSSTSRIRTAGRFVSQPQVSGTGNPQPPTGGLQTQPELPEEVETARGRHSDVPSRISKVNHHALLHHLHGCLAPGFQWSHDGHVPPHLGNTGPIIIPTSGVYLRTDDGQSHFYGYMFDGCKKRFSFVKEFCLDLKNKRAHIYWTNQPGRKLCLEQTRYKQTECGGTESCGRGGCLQCYEWIYTETVCRW
ncbi:hypothetical protein Micbo1qcDRAFT_237410 [Microdochium bolleyi]|uniref:Uncharacterized protein n=1 Tax=Microdochium bolleyi TaxID=196109 RepID=A0A136IKW5_9PEZI|nr:hypothetical protein Micbo1qcDRAFT_237410 [Microdochium bolleyi]